MQITINVGAGKNIAEAFRSYPELVAPFLRIASMKSAFLVERYAKIVTPVDTGRLKSSIATSLGIRDRGITSIVQTNVQYAIYVHEGTKLMRGRPFMKQGVDRAKPEIQKFYQKAVENAIQKVASVAQ